jgi:hypothetical protein
MGEIKHTPGPWTLETVRTSMGICHKIGPFPWKDGKQNSACIYVDYPGNGEIEAELLANARVMRSSPELLEALEYALPYLEACVPNPRNGVNADYSVDVNCVHRARSAIAKARGQS